MDTNEKFLQQMENEHIRTMMQMQQQMETDRIRMIIQQQVDQFTHEFQTNIMHLNQFLYNWQHNNIDLNTKYSFIQFYNSLYKTNEHNIKEHTQAIQSITKHKLRQEIEQEPFNDDDCLSSTEDVNKFIGDLLQ